tara:strand:+ start:1381 stop:3063 length:1683 start_codon:yes stop_codon:yes gene_type:complete
MLFKNIIFILIFTLFYQTPIYSKSNSFKDINYKDLSKYFSGIVALKNKDDTKALDFFNSSKILINQHDPYLKKYIYSLVNENKISTAINVIKQNIDEDNTKFLDAYLLLIVDSLKKNNFKQAYNLLSNTYELVDQNNFNLAILETLENYIFVFKENKIPNGNNNYGNLSIISETFQRCYLEDPNTTAYFSNLINQNGGDFSRYTYFYLSYLVENNKVNEAQIISDDIEFINSILLLSQAKSWIQDNSTHKFSEFFSCKNHNDIVSEFFFIISNLYSSENDFAKSNFYLNLSNYLNPKFIFNLSLVVENQFQNGEFKKAKKTLKNFKKGDVFYYWYRIKKEAQIIAKQKNKKQSLDYLMSNFQKIQNPNNRILLDVANFNRNSKKYEDAIEYYSKIIESLDDNDEIKSDLLYRRGGSYERIKKYQRADEDLTNSLKINPDDAYVLNYLAYSWLERNLKIDEAIEMLEIAYAAKNNDPYIIDSIGWAYYLIKDYIKAENFLRRAVELMPNDPIVNDHYGDILWKLDRKIQARYFWSNVLALDNVDEEMLKKIDIKLVDGLEG